MTTHTVRRSPTREALAQVEESGFTLYVHVNNTHCPRCDQGIRSWQDIEIDKGLRVHAKCAPSIVEEHGYGVCTVCFMSITASGDCYCSEL